MRFYAKQTSNRHIVFVKQIQKEHIVKEKKLYLDFVDIQKAFNRVLRKLLEWATRKKGLPEVIVRSVMSFCHGAKTKV